MAISVTADEKNATFTIDLITHRVTGENFVVKYVAEWAHGDCIGGSVAEAAGPLTEGDVQRLQLDPFDWDGDPALDIVNEDYNWHTIYDGNA